MEPDPSLRRSALHARHVAAGATTAPFGGWEMPLHYAGGGVVAEHKAVRETVGLFDVSHLGTARVRGPGAAAFVDACFTNDLGRVAPGRAQYTLCCDDATGGVVDDLVVYLMGDDEVFLVPNAANAAEVLRRLTAEAPPGVEVVDLHERVAVLAVQGPRSPEVVAALGLPFPDTYMSVTTATWSGGRVVVCRSGYTGELGVELFPSWEDAGDLWDAVVQAGEPLGLRPCGLGARDTLRLEMGYPLHGQDLSLEVTPVQAASSWAVGWDKPRFWGRDVLLREREAGPRRRLRGLRVLERGVPRAHMRVRPAGPADDVGDLGEVTSGGFSPTLGEGVALALLDSAVQLGDEVVLDVRGRPVRAAVVRPPFVRSRVQEAA